MKRQHNALFFFFFLAIYSHVSRLRKRSFLFHICLTQSWGDNQLQIAWAIYICRTEQKKKKKALYQHQLLQLCLSNLKSQRGITYILSETWEEIKQCLERRSLFLSQGCLYISCCIRPAHGNHKLAVRFSSLYSRTSGRVPSFIVILLVIWHENVQQKCSFNTWFQFDTVTLRWFFFVQGLVYCFNIGAITKIHSFTDVWLVYTTIIHRKPQTRWNGKG